ncbi:rfaE bifunctional protein [Pseudarthrobacter chlorophenolicus A6]|uniref:RfaE bifunctional protein n=1 Tax=Pseudarthrobacter chlorophenolicus (strain ATCC 700700 / DSM 12829 / CIP 107037 / JCM 12360 / KCTC 9906 / NCIMB 13794 / A6) TaxID=452863 RepID=B8HB85_PSECP|nr:PfkB family carbohydrate kinase [Pseudarthrobacter chlorophenolicus]ACL38570.1 rfaE bifunctional protein [Pseudarthrobacter chlorophenolicus A6]SDQ46062.1 rfaE bifunctional protein, domain I/rfaE bifunctional protein, domain II [Pseudarthrobacter chlorophenolicus]
MRIVVVGDVMLDVDLSGEATRLSPDAPVPVVDVYGIRSRAGGAGLVARMLAGEGWPVTLVTVFGDDDAGRQLRDHLEGVRVVSGPSGHPTPVKTRVRAGSQAVVRVDQGCGKPPVPGISAGMLRAVEEAGAIIVADYGRGMAANPELRHLLARRTAEVPVIWDPHPSGPDPVPGVAVVTPNLAEATKAAAAFASSAPGDGAPGGPAAVVGRILLERWQSAAVLVTKGAEGAVLLQRDSVSPLDVPAPRVEAGDPCGAGDRLAAGLAVHLLAGSALPEAAELAVNDAADFLGAGGVAALPDRGSGHGLPREGGGYTPASPGAPAAQPEDGPTPLHRSAEPLLLARAVRGNGGTVVATGGCFDLLHAGHVRSLAAARKLGDCLIVCLNSDSSVRRLKGPERPIISQQDRAELLLAMECVDAVMVFDEDTPEAALDRLRPDLWVKGGDYKGSRLPEAELVESWGGRCVTVPYHPARSTTGLADALAKVG